VGYGVLVEVGEINGHRIPLLKKIIRAKDGEMDDKHLKERVLSHVSQHLGGNEVFVHDAGIPIKDVQEAGVSLFTIRLAFNCTARRNELPPRKKTGSNSTFEVKKRASLNLFRIWDAYTL
ncbi:MAG: hypothetical protein GY777_29075, partial [Candidatus Brocadiaceae bacterium]|nr:hypothetical protein [Candidatus Brocadiaceae bacterium]